MDKWICISEKMPEDDQDVLVTIKKGTIISGSYYIRDVVERVVFCDTDSPFDGLPYQHFCILEEKPIVLPIDNIAAWMPLPEPYKE